jgi:hypothetical protein
LYQTPTIQQWKTATRPIARRHIASQPKPEHDIPFEDAEGNLPPTVEEAQSARKTTITDTERAAFEKLYKTFNTQGQGRRKDANGEHEELDQIADEYYEDDEEGSSNSLDKVFDRVLQGSPRVQNSQRGGRGVQPRARTPNESLTPGKEAPVSEADTPQNKRKIAVKAEKERIRKLRIQERDRIDKLLKTAQTDFQLWQILDREVFVQLRKLDLDNPTSTKKEQRSKNKVKATLATNANIDTRILFPNYPHHLLTAIQTLRFYFPRSPLPLTILPTIKSLGRSSYALGATTQLYTHLLRTAWVQQSSYTLVDTLLTDMESNIVEFDLAILELLDGIIREHEMAKTGQLGREMQMVLKMEMWTDGITKIKVWRGVVAERLGVREERVQARVVRRPERRERDGGLGDGGLPLVEGTQNLRSGLGAVHDEIPFVGEQTLKSAPDAVERDVEIQEELSLEEKDMEEADKPTKILL